ncbi:anti-virulence regulator CigR family protein [Hwanghaeella sp.]|uniref:anti-virulence regulator CigR family protein n=1 Tax=Hwanghaeella sp. TaxID=2605943 RepID=UPI003CCC2111
MFGSVRSFSIVSLALVALLFAGTGDVLAKNDKSNGHGQGKSQVHKNSQQQNRLEDEVIDEVLDGIFGENDRKVIEQYVREKGIGTKSLPPGIAKNLARGKPLPPGIAKRGLPADLEGRLPKLREGLQRIIVGDDVTIIEEGTRIVVDILRDVLRRQ